MNRNQKLILNEKSFKVVNHVCIFKIIFRFIQIFFNFEILENRTRFSINFEIFAKNTF